jgi:hypothetical protein
MIALLLAAAVPVFAAGGPSPDYWSRTYSIPASYCSTRFIALPSAVAHAEKALAPCRWTESGGEPVYARCPVLAEERDRLLRRLRRERGILKEASDCRTPPAYPELDEKRETLKREAEEVGLSSSTLPAAAGLVRAEMGALDGLIAAQASAHTPVIEFVVADSTSAASIAAAGKTADRLGAEAFQRAHPYKPHWTHHWARVTYPVCEQVPVAFVSLEAAPGGSEDARARKALRRLGAPFVESGCRFGDATMVLSRTPWPRLARRIVDLPGFVSLRRSPRMRYYLDLADDQRYDELSAELARRPDPLAAAPHVKALVRAEMRRVRPQAVRLRSMRGRRLIVVRLSPPK